MISMINLTDSVSSSTARHKGNSAFQHSWPIFRRFICFRGSAVISPNKPTHLRDSTTTISYRFLIFCGCGVQTRQKIFSSQWRIAKITQDALQVSWSHKLCYIRIAVVFHEKTYNFCSNMSQNTSSVHLTREISHNFVLNALYALINRAFVHCVEQSLARLP